MNIVKMLALGVFLTGMGVAADVSAKEQPTKPEVAVVQKVNLNTADAKLISKSMKGIGLKKAEAIVAYRTANGLFKKVEDLLKVKGIGAATLTKNADKFTI